MNGYLIAIILLTLSSTFFSATETAFSSANKIKLKNLAADDNKRARLALESYKYRILKYIGAYAAVLGGVDVLVFTGGVGENQIQLRRDVVGRLAYLGAEIDDARNNVRGEDALISSDKSKVKVVVIPTDEELMIASDTQSLVSSK